MTTETQRAEFDPTPAEEVKKLLKHDSDITPEQVLAIQEIQAVASHVEALCNKLGGRFGDDFWPDTQWLKEATFLFQYALMAARKAVLNPNSF